MERLEDRLAPSGDFGYALSLGGAVNDQATEVATDGAGNAYVTGQFLGTVDFDPDPANVVNLTSAGLGDAFLAKFSPSGSLLWAQRMGGSGSDRGFSVAIDGAGNAVVAGDFSGTASFGALPSLTSAGGVSDAYVTKLDGNGNFLWAKRVGGTGSDAARDVAVDAQGNVHLVGDFTGTADFDPDAGTVTRTAQGSGSPADVFVLKLTPSGTFTWVQSFGASSAADVGQGIAVDDAGNVYTTGVYRGGANDFDPGPGSSALPFAGTSDVFVSKLDRQGALVWAKGFGGSGNDSASAIAVDAAGNAFLTGAFYGTVDFNPDPAVAFNLSSEGTALDGSLIPDVYIAKFNSTGGLAWAGRIGGSGSLDTVGDLSLDAAGNVYLAGIFGPTADLDPDPAQIFTVTGSLAGPPATGSGGIYVLKLNNAGQFAWARDTSSLNLVQVGGIATDAQGHVYVAGSFAGTTDFDPDPVNVASRTSTPTTTGGSSLDGFLLQLSSGTAVVQPAAEGYAIDGTNDGTFESVDTSDDSIWTRDNDLFRWRGLMEFNLAGLDPGLAVRSATLTVYSAVLESDITQTVDIAIYGYTGDGTVTAADAGVPGILLGQAFNVGLGTLTITLDPAAVQALLAGGPIAGLSVRLLRGSGIALAGSDSVFDPPPTLTLDLESAAIQPPRSRNDAYYLDEDTTLNVALSSGVLDNDDTDRGPLTATLLSGPQVGSLSFNSNGTFSYTPPPNFAASQDPNSLVSFTYRVNDGTADGNVATVFLIVNPVNDAPVAVADSYTTNEDVQMIAAPSVLLNDTDIDSNPADSTAVVDTNPSHGTLFLFANGTFNYRPVADYHGPDSFTYRTKDKEGLLSAPVTVSITVNPVNDAPQFLVVNSTVPINEDAGDQSFANFATNIVPGPATATDEAGQLLHFELTITATTGGLTFTQAPAIGTNGTLTFTAAPNSYGTATVSVVLVDNGGTANGGVDRSTTRIISINVNAVNDAPVAAGDSYTVDQATPLTVVAPGVLANDSDVEGDALTAAVVAAPQHGSLALNPNGSFTYTPAPTFVGLDSFSYKANDGKADGNVVTVTITVNPVTSASFVATDTTTQGNWKGSYGTDGFSIAQDPSANNPSLPSYATVAVTGATPYAWNSSTADPRAPLQAAAGSTNRIASTWYSGGSFTIDVNITDGLSHRVALYALDWDGAQRTETVEVINATTGAVLDTRTLANFQNGVYLVWNLSGNVRLKVTNTGPSNAVATALFFGDAAVPATASFVATDTTTQGNWKGSYGTDGFVLAQDPSANNPSLPSYATVAVAGATPYAWNSSTADPRAPLQAAAGSTNRIASTWYSSGSFTIDVNLTDGLSHRVALYALDWDGAHRTETVEVIDAATGTVLDTRTLANIQNGVYLVWNLSGNVRLKVTNTGPSNAVATALFFGDAVVPATASFVATDTTTQGNWKGAYGADGFVLAQDPSANNPSLPSYATVAVAGATPYAWNSSTADPRAPLQAAAGSTNRIASTWYSSGSFTIDVNLTDGLSHRVALYALDWDGAQRTETVEVIDVATGALLDTRVLANFQGGTYLVWNLKGNVRLRVTNTGPANAVATALFFG